MHPTLSEFVAMVTEAGHIINQSFGILHTVETKDDGTPVTAVDHAVNHMFAEFAKREGLGFIGEEGNGHIENDRILYVDPLDGTGAFTRGIATSTVCASILFQGIPVMAVIHNPMTGQTWSAEYDHFCDYSRLGSKPILARVDAEPQERYRTAICTWRGVPEQFARFKQAVVDSELYADQEMGAFAIGGGLIASGTLHATAFAGSSAVESAAMAHIVLNAGGVAIDLLGNPLERFELGEHNGKKDFLLPNGAIFACSEEVAQALCRLYQDP